MSNRHYGASNNWTKVLYIARQGIILPTNYWCGICGMCKVLALNCLSCFGSCGGWVALAGCAMCRCLTRLKVHVCLNAYVLRGQWNTWVGYNNCIPFAYICLAHVHVSQLDPAMELLGLDSLGWVRPKCIQWPPHCKCMVQHISPKRWAPGTDGESGNLAPGQSVQLRNCPQAPAIRAPCAN